MSRQGSIQGRIGAVGMLVAVLATGVIAWGCTAAEEPTAAPTEEMSAETSPTPVSPGVSINAMMVAIVDHAAHMLWNAEIEEQAPQTDDDWREIGDHAIQIAAAGTAISIGGTGQADPGWVVLPDWKPFAQEMTDSGLAALKAAQAKDLEALISANTRLVETCEQCHAAFKPDLPSEGIVHQH